MFALMTVKELYRNYLTALHGIYNLNEATAITDLVFETIASFKRTDIIKYPKKTLHPPLPDLLQNALSQLLEHKPVQYVLSEAWFYNLKFKINEHVLIPRPETEELVEQVILNRDTKILKPRILDIGTGSGCIPVILKKNIPDAEITAIDLSENALLVARENAAHHKTTVDFIQMDFLSEPAWQSLPRFDTIVSNPPYIPLNEREKLAKNVQDYEPHAALFVPENAPLLFYKKIALFSKTNLQLNGIIFLETHEDLAKDVALLFEQEHFRVEIKKDGSGKERIVMAST